jgi:predicted transcriptional regulator
LARTKSPTLTDAELRLMEILWDKGEATAAEVVQCLPGDARLAHTTVLTTLRILEEKGYLRHIKDGKAFVYHPIVDRTQASRSALRYLVSRFFRNSPELLVSHLITDETLSSKERRRLKELIEESE